METTKTHYIIEGRRYDRVTSVLGYFTPPKLLSWLVKQGADRKAGGVARRLGTKVHKVIQEFHSSGKWKVKKADSVSVKNCIEGYKRWLEEESPMILDTEHPEYCGELGIAGTRDLRLPGVIVDIKTSNAIQLSYWVQLAVYAYLHKEPIETLAVLRLDKFTGDYEYKKIPNDSRLFNVFLGLLNAYRFYNANAWEMEKEEDSGVTCTEIEDKSGFLITEAGDDWSKWYREV